MIEQLNAWGRARRPFFFCIDYEKKAPLYYPLDQLPQTIRYTMHGEQHARQHHLPTLHAHPMSYECYAKQYHHVQEYIRSGHTYLLNLTCATPLTLSWDLHDIYHHAQAPFKLCVDEKFVLFSPERFVKITDNTINTYPMKGTIDATLPDAQTLLLDNPKELAEHTMVVDLLRNDLSRVATNVRVASFRYIQTIHAGDKELLQTSSHIQGQLPNTWHETIGTILDGLLPAGSITGTPKKETCRIIQETEQSERGYYTGVFGVYDGQSLDSAVMIRFIEKTPHGLVYRSGGGITCESDPLLEYQEMVAKVYVPVS